MKEKKDRFVELLKLSQFKSSDIQYGIVGIELENIPSDYIIVNLFDNKSEGNLRKKIGSIYAQDIPSNKYNDYFSFYYEYGEEKECYYLKTICDRRDMLIELQRLFEGYKLSGGREIKDVRYYSLIFKAMYRDDEMIRVNIDTMNFSTVVPNDYYLPFDMLKGLYEKGEIDEYTFLISSRNVIRGFLDNTSKDSESIKLLSKRFY